MKKIISMVCYILYNGVAKHMPKSNCCLSFGAKRIRVVLAKGFVKHIGNNVNIEKGAVFGRSITIGNNSGVGINCIIQGKVTIHDNVIMGPEVYIYTRNHRHDMLNIPMIQQGFEEEREVVIDDDVWIGSRVTILPGVHVGKGSILGAASVITKDVPPYVIMGGNPAKILKERG